jgi:hypothetical protein
VLRIADEALNRLRNGEDPKIVRESYRSQSQVTEGFRLYLAEQQKQLEEKRANLINVDTEKDKVTTIHNHLLQEKKELANDVDSLKTQKTNLRKDVDETRIELDSLREETDVLRKRGYTESITHRLAESVDLNGSEVWRILESVEVRAKLTEEIDIKRNEKEQNEREATLLEAKTRKTQDRLYNAEKQLAKTEAKEATLSGEVKLIETCIRADYKLEDIRALLSYITEKNIGKTPNQSIGHLLQRIEAIKSLEDTSTEVKLAEERLTEILELEKQAKTRIQLMETTSISAINEQKAVGTKCIQEYATKTNEWLHSTLVGLQNEINKTLTFSADVARLEREKSQLEALIVPAKTLLGLLASEEFLRLVQPMLVIQLLERFQLWLELRWPSVMINVIQDITSFELRLGMRSVYGTKMASLIKVAIDAIKQQLSLEEHTGSNYGREKK